MAISSHLTPGLTSGHAPSLSLFNPQGGGWEGIRGHCGRPSSQGDSSSRRHTARCVCLGSTGPGTEPPAHRSRAQKGSCPAASPNRRGACWHQPPPALPGGGLRPAPAPSPASAPLTKRLSLRLKQAETRRRQVTPSLPPGGRCQAQPRCPLRTRAAGTRTWHPPAA